jgi:sugar phosphate isomerase/epimerase
METAALVSDLSKLCIHTITNKPWSIDECIENYAQAGVKGITIWRDCKGLTDANRKQAGQRARDEGLEIVSYVRGGFFPATDAAKRQVAIDDNKRIIAEAAELGAPLIVLVCGADPGQSLEASRQQIAEGIAAVLPEARAAGVKLGIEPLHPMYADTRSAVNTMSQANALAEELDSDWLGVVADVYHLWWDPALKSEIARCGKHGNLFAYHICDWRVPTEHMLFDRGIMGEGCIELRKIRKWIEATGFDGFNEVEIFSEKRWAMDQSEYIQHIIDAYLQYS